MPLQTDAIWLPGQGMTSISERQVAEAVAEYDPDLMLGQRRDTGEWCAFLPGNRASEGQPFPVYSFGTTLPSADDAKKQLYEHDIRRHGHEILDQLERIHDAEQREYERKVSDASEAVAEAIASNMEMKGVHPFPSIKMSGKYKKGHVRSSG